MIQRVDARRVRLARGPRFVSLRAPRFCTPAVLRPLFNPCHDEKGRFCPTLGAPAGPTSPLPAGQKEWEASLSPDQKDLVEQWSGKGNKAFDVMAKIRRLEVGGGAAWEKDDPNIQKMQADWKHVMTSGPRFEGTAYRGVGTNLKVQEGDTFTFAATSSTTRSQAVAEFFMDIPGGGISPGGARSGTLIRLQTKSGVAVERLVQKRYKTQKEVLVPAGTGFKVKSVVNVPLTWKAGKWVQEPSKKLLPGDPHLTFIDLVEK